MAEAEDKKPGGHNLADHLLGENLAHEHDEYTDHDHDHFEFDNDGPIEQNPIWMQDHVTLVSVGIDIGSAGTQVIFSRINLRRYGEDLTSRYYVVSRETLYQSPVALTPYLSEERIDDAALGRIIDEAYAGADLHPDKIDTGAVILTGEALRRENAEAIARLLSEQGGEFVCATAGHHMESMLAAYGSGLTCLPFGEQAYPQYRYRRWNDETRGCREGTCRGDSRFPCRRSPAGCRRQRAHPAARSRRSLPCPASRLRLEQGRRD